MDAKDQYIAWRKEAQTEYDDWLDSLDHQALLSRLDQQPRLEDLSQEEAACHASAPTANT